MASSEKTYADVMGTRHEMWMLMTVIDEILERGTCPCLFLLFRNAMHYSV